MKCDWCKEEIVDDPEYLNPRLNAEWCSLQCMRNWQLTVFNQGVGEWVAKNFDAHQPSAYPLIGAAEEIGEIADLYNGHGRIGITLRMIAAVGKISHSVLKQAQGIREDDIDVGRDAEQAALADLRRAAMAFNSNPPLGKAEPIEEPEELADGIGDEIVYLADLCDKLMNELDEPFTLGEALEIAWDDEVKFREWDSDVVYE